MTPDYKARKCGRPTMSTAERIKNKVAVNPYTKCWEWQGSKKNGYGHTIVGSRTNGTRKSISAHRLSYITFKGEIPSGAEICHKCDNPCCVNPEHLFVGTRQDNVDDREAKGRNNPQCGEKNGKAKLSKHDVLEIRRKSANGMSFQRIADEYKVHKKTIWDIVNRKNWGWLSTPEPPEVKS